MTPVRLSPLAALDIERAAAHYEMEREGVADKFVDRVEQAMEKIALNPRGYAKIMGENRRCNLEKFPYALFLQGRPGSLYRGLPACEAGYEARARAVEGAGTITTGNPKATRGPGSDAFDFLGSLDMLDRSGSP